MNADLGRLSAAEQRIVSAALAAARKTGTVPWLVGGAVRDLLLGLEPGDLDITIEGDAERFAHELASTLGATVVAHPRFLTFRLDVDGAPLLDVVTARRESYAAPGSLPSVERGSIEDDLLRRDFAANSIAADLRSGALFDPAGGVADIRRRELRVLHPASFLDDPTRIFRGVRLAQRLAFHFDAMTTALADTALHDGAHRRVSKERLWHEVRLGVSEPAAAAILDELARRGCLDPLLGHSPVANRSELARTIDLARAHGVDPLPALIALLGGATDELLAHAELDRHERAAISRLTGGGGRLAERIASFCELRAFATLDRHGVTSALFAAAVRPTLLEPASRWLAVHRLPVPIGIAAEELRPAGRKRIGRAVRRARFAVAWENATVTEASAFAHERLIQYLRRSTSHHR